MTDHDLARAQTVKAKYEDELLRRPNVIGVGVGLRQRGGNTVDEVCIVVNVVNKHPVTALNTEEILPEEIEGIPVDVQEVGTISAGA